MQYIGYFKTSSGTRYAEGLKSNNIYRLKKLILEVLRGNMFVGNTGRWWIEEYATKEEKCSGRVSLGKKGYTYR